MAKNELKKQLHSYRAVQLERRQLEERLKETRLLMDGLRGGGMNGMPRGSGVSDPVANLLARYEAMEAKYNALRARLADAALAVEELIENLNSLERTLMRCRYIDGQTWEQECVSIGYSWRRTHQLHAEALEKLTKGSE